MPRRSTENKFLKARKDWLLVVEITAIGSWPMHAWYLSEDGFVRRKQWTDTTSLQHQLPKNARSSGHFGTQKQRQHNHLVRQLALHFDPHHWKTNGNIAVTLIATTLSARPIWKHFASGKACSLLSFHFLCTGLFQTVNHWKFIQCSYKDHLSQQKTTTTIPKKNVWHTFPQVVSLTDCSKTCPKRSALGAKEVVVVYTG